MIAWLLMIFMWLAPVHASSLGSNTAVTRLNSQSTLFNGMNVAAFTALVGGFYLNDVNTTATWSSVFATAGQIDLNNGSLYLGTDLLIGDIVNFNSLGTIIGNSNAVDFSPTLTALLAGCNLMLTTSTASTIGNNRAGWAYSDVLTSLGATSTSTTSIAVYPFNGLTLSAPTLNATANTTGAHAWHPSAYFIAVNTGVAVNTITTYSVTPATGLFSAAISSIVLTGQPQMIAWHPSGFYIAAVCAATTRIEVVPVSATGVLGTSVGLAGLGGAAACDWVSTGTYLAAGYQATTGLAVYALGGTPASPTLTLKTTAVTGSNVTGVKWNPVYTNILAVTLNTSTRNVLIYSYDAVGNTLTLLSTAQASTFLSSVDWSSDGSCLLLSAGNNLSLFCYNNSTNALTLCNNYPVPVIGFSRFSPVNNYVVYGANSAPLTIRIYSPSTRNGSFSNLNMVLNNDLVLHNCQLTFAGDCSILGNGYTLDLDGTATLAVASGAILRLKGVTLSGMTDGCIKMVGSTSQLLLEDVAMILDASYSFTQGSFTVSNELVISGRNNQFNYLSSSASTINSNSTLYLDSLVTFSYNPSSSSKSLLQFIDSTSTLVLHGATLAASFTGMSLTNGTLMAQGHAYLSSSARVAGEGITFGNGSLAANNMQIQVAPAAVLEVTSGYVNNSNV